MNVAPISARWFHATGGFGVASTRHVFGFGLVLSDNKGFRLWGHRHSQWDERMLGWGSTCGSCQLMGIASLVMTLVARVVGRGYD